MPRVVHFEIPADDPERAAQFYQSVFGWTIQTWGGPEPYWLIITGPDSEMGINGAIMRRGEPLAGSGLTGYICTVGVPSIDKSLAKVTASGGTVITEKTQIPGIGWQAYCRDTEGNQFSILQPDMPAG